MSDLCQNCLNAEWDSYSYHSSKECGLPGSSEQMVFCGCNRMDEIPEEVVTAIANCDDVEVCPEYIEGCDSDE